MMTLEEDEVSTKRKKTIIDHVHDGVSIAQEFMAAVEEGVGIAASPSIFWLIFLKNSYCGNGFSGFISNPTVDVVTQAQNAGLSPPSSQAGPTDVGSYKGWEVYLMGNGTYQGFEGGFGGRSTAQESTIAAVTADIEKILKQGLPPLTTLPPPL